MAAAPILVTQVPQRHFDLGQAIRAAAAARGISALRLGAEILRRQLGRQRLPAREYFVYGAHRARLTPAERDCFIGDGLGSDMCAALLGRDGVSVAGLQSGKLVADRVLTRAGLPVPRIQAVAGGDGADLPAPHLPDATAVTRFLDHDGALPLFGKPARGSNSLGAVSILTRPAPGRLELGDGREVSCAQFADEVFRHFPTGYLFQDMLRPHPAVAALTGPVVPTLRLVTLRTGPDEVCILYGGIKSPGKGAMVDGAASMTTLEAAADVATGRILRLQDPRRLGGNDLAQNPVTGAAMAGALLPGWAAGCDLARAAHGLFPTQGVVGGDIALTPQGPVIVELNSHPGMSFYQKTMARGLWNRDLAPALTEALARAGHRRPTRKLPLPWKDAA